MNSVNRLNPCDAQRLLFVLPVKGGSGGAHSVAQEVDELLRFGADVQIAVNARNAPSFMTQYADLPRVHEAIRVFDGAASLAGLMADRDLVICTIFTSVETVAQALDTMSGSRPRIGYYIQDYEPLFCAADDPLRKAALDSYNRIPGALLFAKTDWIRDMVTLNHDVPVAKIEPSIDTSIYYPAMPRNRGAIWIAAMVRPHTRRRAPRRTMSVLKELKEHYGEAVSISIFGCSDEDVVENQLPHDFDYTNHGKLSRRQVSTLFRSTEVVMDLSDYQAFGRTGLEAMACGCATILPVLGGTHEYAVDGVNAMLVDTRSKAAIVQRFADYVALPDSARQTLRQAAIGTSQGYSVARAAWSEMQVFSEFLAQ